MSLLSMSRLNNGNGPRFSRRRSNSTLLRRRAIILLLAVVVACTLRVTAAFSSPAAHSVLFSTQSTCGTSCRTSSLLSPTQSSSCLSRRDSSSAIRLLAKKSYGESHPLFPDFFPGVGISAADKTLLGAMTACVVALFSSLLAVSGPGAWRYFLAGGICAATSHAITTPIDVVKVRSYHWMKLNPYTIIRH